MIELIEKKYLTPPDNEAIPVLKCFFCEEEMSSKARTITF